MSPNRLRPIEVVALGAVVASFLGGVIPICDLLAHVRMHGCAVLVAIGLTAAWRGRWRAALAMGIATRVQGFPVAALLLESLRSAEVRGPELTVLAFNAQVENPRKAEFADFLNQTLPDLVVLTEATDELCDRIEEGGHYERVIADLRTGEDAKRSTCVHRRRECPIEIVATEIQRPDDSRFALTILSLHLRLGDRDFDLYVPRFPPPIPGERLSVRNTLMRAICTRSGARVRPALLVADLNTTPFAAEFQSLLERGGFVDLGAGFGYCATWPDLGGWAFLGLPLDRMLGTPEFVAREFEVVPRSLASDHRALRARLVLGLAAASR